MSSLHPDRLPAEGPAPASGTRSTLAAAPGKTSRRATGRAKGTAEVPAKATASHTSRTAAQRTGKLPAQSSSTPQGSSAARARTVRTAAATATATARAARTVTAKAARSATATAKAASAKAAGAKAASAGKRAAATPAAAPKATAAAKPAVAPKAPAEAAASKAAPAKAAASKAAPAKSAASEAAPVKTAASKAAASKAAPAKAAPAKAAPTEATVAAERTPSDAPTPRPARRPTPYKRTVVTHDGPAESTPEDAVLAAAAAIVEAGSAVPTDVPGADVPVADAAEERATAAPSPRRVRIRHRRPPSPGRRPALYLAAALVGALGIGGVSAGGPAALAGTTTVSSSVSVAEKLGITSDSAEVVEAQAPDRLGELVASRAERDAEQADAAAEQKAADEEALEKKRAAAEAAAEAARPKAVAPVKGARLTSGYGARWGTLHAGIDLAAPMHTPEYAVMDGVVLEAGPASGFGLAVYIQHENGDVTVYGHMDSILVQAGQVVKAGDTIALLGNRGQSTGPHLHFEVHQGGLDGTKVDPIPWLRDRGVDL